MRFLLDQDVYLPTIRFLTDLGHDVLLVEQIGHSRAPDSELLRIAQEQDRIFVTRDRDFGGLVFLTGSGAGVIYLRVSPSTMQAVHEQLATVLASYSEDELKTAFVVVEPGRYRFRRLSAP
jgi:predicted nuclease of predicted toxin-antitoxin system